MTFLLLLIENATRRWTDWRERRRAWRDGTIGDVCTQFKKRGLP